MRRGTTPAFRLTMKGSSTRQQVQSASGMAMVSNPASKLPALGNPIAYRLAINKHGNQRGAVLESAIT
jgi:hypothetical protein